MELVSFTINFLSISQDLATPSVSSHLLMYLLLFYLFILMHCFVFIYASTAFSFISSSKLIAYLCVLLVNFLINLFVLGWYSPGLSKIPNFLVTISCICYTNIDLRNHRRFWHFYLFIDFFFFYACDQNTQAYCKIHYNNYHSYQNFFLSPKSTMHR